MIRPHWVSVHRRILRFPSGTSGTWFLPSFQTPRSLTWGTCAALTAYHRKKRIFILSKGKSRIAHLSIISYQAKLSTRTLSPPAPGCLQAKVTCKTPHTVTWGVILNRTESNEIARTKPNRTSLRIWESTDDVEIRTMCGWVGVADISLCGSIVASFV